MINDVYSIRKKNIIVLPKNGTSDTEQLKDCLSQLDEKLSKLNLDKNRILKQHIFFKGKNKSEFLRKKRQFQNILDIYYYRNTPPTSIIAQSHAGDINVAMEITLSANNDQKIKIENKSTENINYKVISYVDYKEVFACGLTSSNLLSGIREQAEIAFSKMKKILDNEGLDFADVVRQWNYIEKIFRIEYADEQLQQNYQVFNDVRSKYYKNAEFRNGYPAATGIGMESGGVVIDFIASSKNKNIAVRAVKNPKQIDAHRYSKNVLVGKKDSRITSPKFERAKAVFNHRLGEIYISGTAAIRGEGTIEKKDIITQLSVTIENIKELVSVENLKKNGVFPPNDKVMISSLRIYVKNESDIDAAAAACEQYFSDVPKLCLIADICREDLLVEIEGKAKF